MDEDGPNIDDTFIGFTIAYTRLVRTVWAAVQEVVLGWLYWLLSFGKEV